MTARITREVELPHGYWLQFFEKDDQRGAQIICVGSRTVPPVEFRQVLESAIAHLPEEGVK